MSKLPRLEALLAVVAFTSFTFPLAKAATPNTSSDQGVQHNSQYAPMTDDELYEFVLPSIGLENSFLGTKVKVHGYFFSWSPGVDGVKRRSALLCNEPKCDGMGTFEHETTFRYLKRKFQIGYHVANPTEFQSLHRKTRDICTKNSPCHMIVLGELKQLQYINTIAKDIDRAFGQSKNETKPDTLVYVEVSALRIYNSDRNATFEVIGSTVEMAKELAPLVPWLKAIR